MLRFYACVLLLCPIKCLMYNHPHTSSGCDLPLLVLIVASVCMPMIARVGSSVGGVCMQPWQCYSVVS